MTPDQTSPAAPPWSARETELLAVTLELLKEHGYDGLSIDAVAARAHASKATVYRRWPSKAELVLAAFTQSVQQEFGAPNTGTLRGDLLRLGTLMCEQADQHTGTLAAVRTELSGNPALAKALQQEFVDQRKAAMHQVLHQAVDRGEIVAGVISDEVWDVLPGYLVSRYMIPGRPVTEKTVEALVDEVMLPSLTRRTQ
ncbi:MAG: TetR/AcrR family transcriptional regulator [Mycobacterium sp.]